MQRSIRSTWSRGACLGVMLALLGLGTSCNPRGHGGDPENDQNILVGRTHVRDGRYADAEQAFMRALQNHPDSATAHLEMGKLYYAHLQDLPGALYHLNRYARLRPKENRDVLGLMTNRCLQELATLVPLGAINQQIQSEINRWSQTNQALRVEVERLRRQVSQLQAERPLALSTLPQRAGTDPTPRRSAEALSPPVAQAAAAPPERSASPAQAPRRHKVAAKETVYSIARTYRIDPNDLIRANPGINPNRIQIGQEINLPQP